MKSRITLLLLALLLSGTVSAQTFGYSEVDVSNINANPLYLNLDSSTYSFEALPILGSNRTLHIKPDGSLDENNLTPITGNDHEIIIKMISQMIRREDLMSDDVEEFIRENTFYYVGSKKISTKLSYHFVLENDADYFQNMYMLSTYNKQITSIIHTEQYSNHADSDRIVQQMKYLSARRCIMTRHSLSADTMTDYNMDTSNERYVLYMKNGRITRFRYFVKKQ